MNELNQDQNWADKLLSFITDSDEVNNALSSNLVEYLAHKGVIDIEEYLRFTQQNKEKYLARLAEAGYADDSQIIGFVNSWFNMHINDFKKD